MVSKHDCSYCLVAKMLHSDNISPREDSKLYFLKNKATAIKIVALLSLVAIFYHQDFIIIGNEALKSEITSYILVIPFLWGCMIYRKRKVLRAAMHFRKQRRSMELGPDEILGFALYLSSILLYVYGSYSFYFLQWHMLSLPLFVSGCILLMFNYEVLRESIFPIVFLLLLMPLPLDILHEIGTQTSFSTLMLSYNILKAFNLPVGLQLEDALITVQNPVGETTSFMIDVPCGGLYTIIGFLVFAIFASYIIYGPLRKKGALFSIGFLLIYLLNILRVVVTVSISYFLNSRVGVDLFHMLGGPTLIFLASIMLLFVGNKAFSLEIVAHKDERNTYHPSRVDSNEPFCYMCGKLLNPFSANFTKRDLAKFLTILTMVSLIVLQLPSMALAGSSLKIDVKNSTGEEMAEQFLPNIEEYELKFIYRDRYFETKSGQDASLAFAYLPKEEGKSIVWITVEIADAMSKLHGWEICTFFWPRRFEGKTVDVIELKDVQILSTPLIGRFFIFNPRESDSTVSILYWYEKAVFNVASNWGPRYAKISLLIYLEDLIESGEIEKVEEYPKIESKLLPIAQDIAIFWEPVRKWSIFTPLFAKWAPVIIFSAIATSLFIKVMLELQKRKNRARSYKRVKLASRFVEKDKKALTIVEILRKHGKATGKEVFELYKKVSRESIDFNDFLQILKYAEDQGLIERDIKNSRDEGLLVWKTEIASRKFIDLF